MTVSSNPLVEAGFAANAETTIYTSTAARTIVDKCSAYNSDTAAQTITFKIVASGGSAATSNVIVAKTLAPGETYIFPEMVGQVLAAGDFISELAGAASKVSRRLSGRVVT